METHLQLICGSHGPTVQEPSGGLQVQGSKETRRLKLVELGVGRDMSPPRELRCSLPALTEMPRTSELMAPPSPELVRPHLYVPDPGVTGPRGKGVPTSKKHPQDALSQTTWPGKHLELCLGHRKPQQGQDV